MSKIASVLGMAAILAMPTFGAGNDMRNIYKNKFYNSESNKPNNRRKKVKASRKANLKQLKK